MIFSRPAGLFFDCKRIRSDALQTYLNVRTFAYSF